MSKMRVCILGATGSIGTQTLDVCAMHKDMFEVVALSACSSVDKLVDAALRFKASYLALSDEQTKDASSLAALPQTYKIGFGSQAVADLVSLEEVDIVLNALSGAAGLRASYDTLKAGKKLALANKESLVVGGDLIMPLATHDTLLPVDSEHSAIYQCYLGEYPQEAHRIWLTCSGGPFRGCSREQLATKTKHDALAHPTWKMGPKITIDCSTLMNKGLEVLEAHHLFGVDIDDVRVVIHPQSCIHSMVEYVDGSVKAHLGAADMRIPIQFALTYPHRYKSPVETPDFTKICDLQFLEPDYKSFRCLKLALAAGKEGGTMPCVMNAANEVAVAYFLQDKCGFTDIDACVEECMNHFSAETVTSLEQLETCDAQTREYARKFLWK